MSEIASKFIESLSALFSQDNQGQLLSLISSNLEMPSENEIISLCEGSILSLKKVPTLLYLSSPIVIVGDIHGNFYDLIRIFNKMGKPPQTTYLFLGDYVDRGNKSLQCILLLLSFLIIYPNNIYLLRGNHEFQHINRLYGFFEEVQSETIWSAFQEVFAWFPLAAVIDEQLFCVHGGLSPMLTLQDIQEIVRPVHTYEFLPLVCNLVWSDPDESIDTYRPNMRGAGVLFGHRALKAFLHDNKLKMIIRAHQCIANGIDTFINQLGLTVFSSSNYVQLFPNKCGVAFVRNDSLIEAYNSSHNSDFESFFQVNLTSNIIQRVNSFEPSKDKILPSLNDKKLSATRMNALISQSQRQLRNPNVHKMVIRKLNMPPNAPLSPIARSPSSPTKQLLDVTA